MRSVLSVGLVLSLVIGLVSCAQPPTKEMNDAQSALDAAKRAEADIYVADTYMAAKKALDDARAKAGENQKDYEGAKASAIRAKELADQARSQVDAAKQKIRSQAQAIIDRISSGMADARASLNNAPSGKGADENLDQLRSDLGQAEASLSSARSNIGSGKLKDALAQAQSAEGKFSRVQAAMQTAMQKIEDWKKANRPWYEL